MNTSKYLQLLCESSSENFDKSKIIKEIKSLDLPIGKYSIFGSGPMVIRNLRKSHDIDIIVTTGLWDQLSLKFEVKKSETSNSSFLSYNNIEFWKNWYPGKWNIEKLIKESDIFYGLPFVKLDEVYKWKKLLGRDKDKKDLMIINNYKGQ